jgi:elongation factor 1 alpha-like protein
MSGSRGKEQQPSTAPEIKPEPQKPPSGAEEPITAPEPVADLRAHPSTFASTIIGDWTRKEPPRINCSSHNVDIAAVLGQDLTKTFTFTEPSPDDIVIKAQSAAKGRLYNAVHHFQ